ncbi:MAG TPA: DUF1697 domain-containing protein [Pyrinomonadaceae bacterium]
MEPMISYAAFLRGINVGGQKSIKMEALARVFISAGLKNVRTLLASGNVVFQAPETDPDVLARKIEKKLTRAFGHEIIVVIMTADQLKAAVRRNPFKKIEASRDIMRFVTFLVSEPVRKPKVPLKLEKENLELLAIRDRVVFILARRKENGWFGFPHEFAERLFGTRTTTRNLSTVQRILKSVESQPKK